MFGHCSEPDTLGRHGRHAVWHCLADRQKTKGTATGANASSRYWTTFKLPSINTKWVLCLKLIPTQTIKTGPSPAISLQNVYVSKMFTSMMPNTETAVGHAQFELRLIRKQGTPFHLRAFKPRCPLDHGMDDGSEAPLPEGDCSQSDRWSCSYGGQELV